MPRNYGRDEARASDTRVGFVYFAQRSDGAIKIGFTQDLRLRLYQHARARGEQLTLLGVLPGTARLERELHQWFRADRVAGECNRLEREWFRSSETLRSWIVVFATAQLDDCRRALSLSNRTNPALSFTG